MTKIKWTKNVSIGHDAELNGFELSRVKLQSGRFHYYVHWIENPHYAAPNRKMSEVMYSMAAIKARINGLKQNYNCVSKAQFRTIRGK